ncbi:MAG: hypothetical protein OJF49_004793 [Ktedonobacterales bacterium]|jgi:RNA polymerase sigma-70 factor (ECF subfamily)|nr:MAG: hypothetical protein OJF49_004793 [Ktedonobacterales bacterium]
MNTLTAIADNIHGDWLSERGRLVKLCAHLTSRPDIAEDLAHEALLEAWRHQGTLRDPDRFAQWLSGIARNVCLRWARRQGRDLAHIAELSHNGDGAPLDLDDALLAETDLEFDLERHELALLLDRALALLPPETRSVLIAHYVEESPLAQVAAQLGVNASAVAMRLQRGKVALRRVLTTEFSAEMAAYRPDVTSAHGWQETRIWCLSCGQRRLLGRYHPSEGELWLRCPDCSHGEDLMIHTHALEILGGVQGYQRAYNRLFGWIDRFYRPHLATRTVPCLRCGNILPLHVKPLTPSGPPTGATPPLPPEIDAGLYYTCPLCERDCWESLGGLVLALPEARRFQRRNQRIRSLPTSEVEYSGRPALVTRFASVAGQEQLVAVSAADTLELLMVEG